MSEGILTEKIRDQTRNEKRQARVDRLIAGQYARGALIHVLAEQFTRSELGAMFDDTGGEQFPGGQPWLMVVDALGEAWASHEALREWAPSRSCPVGVHDGQGRCRA